MNPVSLTVINIGRAAATFQIAVVPDPFAQDPDTSDVVSVTPASLQLAAGQQSAVTVSLTGGLSVPGMYDGVIGISGPGTNLRVPYWYLETDGVPFDILPVFDSSFTGTAGDTCQYLAFKVVDLYGIAVPNQPAAFSVAEGSGSQSTSASCPAGVSPGPAAATNVYGMAWTNVDLDRPRAMKPSRARREASRSPLRAVYVRRRRLAPTGWWMPPVPRWAVAPAPGSCISIYGTALSDATESLSTSFLPFSMAGVSVSFASPDGSEGWPTFFGMSAPARSMCRFPGSCRG